MRTQLDLGRDSDYVLAIAPQSIRRLLSMKEDAHLTDYEHQSREQNHTSANSLSALAPVTKTAVNAEVLVGSRWRW